MASIKVKFRPSTVNGHKGTIYYHIFHEKKARQLLTDYKVYPCEWDDSRSMPVTTAPQACGRHSVIRSIREHIRWDIERLNKINRRLEARGLAYTASDLIDEFNSYVQEYTLFNFMETNIARLRQNGKTRTAETYRATLNSFKKFLAYRAANDNNSQYEDLMLDRLTPDIMEAYEAWHRQRGITPNTISFYTRILRAVYNRALENRLIENLSPFKHVYTGISKTVKRALPLPYIKKIKLMELSMIPALDYARDMFILSFYLRGMSFIDMAFLKKSNLNNGYVVYRRRKTGQQLVIKWTKDMQMILDKYPENDSDYLLPIIRNSDANERYIYRNAGYNINRNLKQIARMAGITISLTLYVARHSWASAAKAKGIPLSVISEGMGHDSETTTQIYLASLETSVVDQANSLIIESLR
ncbi:MAG: site-specific integrase [Muribaculaceae bacterium]|nr:site-specific integrase [Muribaculaceae bacterium]